MMGENKQDQETGDLELKVDIDEDRSSIGEVDGFVSTHLADSETSLEEKHPGSAGLQLVVAGQGQLDRL